MLYVDIFDFLYNIHSMNIQEYANIIRKERQGQSYSFLAERVSTSEEAPHRIAVLKKPVSATDAIVVAFGGSGEGANIIGHNWFIKYINNFIRSKPTLNDARVCVAVCDFGENYEGDLARYAYNVKKSNPGLWNFMAKVTKHPIVEFDKKNSNPLAAQDIFNNVFLPKLVNQNGERFSTQDLLKNMRGVTVIAYCSGGHTAMFLEEYMISQMEKMGYDKKEIKLALNQIVVIGYAMTCPYKKSNMHFMSFNSLADNHKNAFSNYLYFSSTDFGVMHNKDKQNDAFLCTQISKRGIEGNPNIWYAMKIEDYMDLAEKQNADDWKECKDDIFNEHTFLGFVEKNGYSNGAKNLQKLFKSVIVSTVENSIQNSKSSKFIPLPDTEDLVAENIDIYGRANLSYMQQRTLYNPIALPVNLLYQGKETIKLCALRKLFKSICSR